MALKLGVQLHPQATTVDELRDAWKAADAMGADSIWVWDHFFPLYGDPDAPHFEAYTLLAAMAADTANAHIGAMVTCNSYRNPELLADMARTIDHISHGRFVLGIGSGWFERDYEEYGYEFGTPGSRVRALEAALPVIRERIGRLNPPPVRGHVPILMGGGGERIFLRLVAEHADEWNFVGNPEWIAQKSAVLDEHCRAIGRDPAEIARSVLVPRPGAVDDVDAYAEIGVTHLIVTVAAPEFDFEPAQRLLAWRDASNGRSAG